MEALGLELLVAVAGIAAGVGVARVALGAFFTLAAGFTRPRA
jgi:hypothetical protein